MPSNPPRPRPSTKAKLKRVQRLIDKGVTDDEKIAAKLQVRRSTVRKYRRQLGIKRTSGHTEKWSKELILELAREWVKRYGTLSANDWNPYNLNGSSYLERVRRFNDFGAPSERIVRKKFGTWNEMKRQAGLPIVEKPVKAA